MAVGPGSVEYRLKEEALIFGGKTLVATDVAVARGLLKGIGDESQVSHLSKDLVEKAVGVIQQSVERAVDFVKVIFIRVCLCGFIPYSSYESFEEKHLSYHLKAFY